MSSALDSFERSLVAASRALSSSPLESPRAGVSARRAMPRRRRLLSRVRSLGAVAQAGIALAALSACAGAAVAGYLLIAGAQARMLPEFECQIDGSDAGIQAVTGSPILDCATSWPSASGGREAAPPLAVWGVTSGQRLVAVVRPARLGPPPAAGGPRWARLPDSWTVDLRLVALNDQLSNIDQPFTELPPALCSFARADASDVRSLLQADGLRGWKVEVRGSNGPVSRACRPTTPAIDAASRTVLLVQSGVPSGQAIGRGLLRAHDQLLALYTEVNRQLGASCQSVPAAVRLWTRVAKAAGYTPTTLAWWRQLNARGSSPQDIAKRYTLYKQPSSQRTGRCAHVLVMEAGGSGIANVYVARIRP